MPDTDTQVQDPIKDSVIDDKSKEIDVDEKIKAAIELASQDFKAQISGLDKKNTELQKELKDKELEGKTEEEKNEALKLENKRIEDENSTLIRNRLIDKQLDSAGLPLDFANRIIGVDEANTAQDIAGLKEYIENLAQEKADKIINEKLGGDPPKGDITDKKGVDPLKRFGDNPLDTMKIATEKAQQNYKQ